MNQASTQQEAWSCVQRTQGTIYVAKKLGVPPQPQPGQARVRIISASICGADLRIASGDKDAHTTATGAITMGHEGCGIIDELGEGPTSLHVGDLVVVLPHIHTPADHGHGCTYTTPEIEAVCTSRHHTDHAGWDFHGVFSDIGVYPMENLIVVPKEHLTRAERQSPELGRALFTITEPLLCCLSAYELLQDETVALRHHRLSAGRALVVGCGPIGVMHGILLAERGYEVWFYDVVPQRAKLAQLCLDGGDHYDPTSSNETFDLVVVTANVLPAIHLAEHAVSAQGSIYLFAGMNARDRNAAHPSGFTYEAVHRQAQGIVAATGSKRLLYVGHSGYYARLAPKAIALVSANAGRLSQLMTGVIDGWANPVITSRTPGVADWRTPDGSPAIQSVLSGKADLRAHGKLMVRIHPSQSL